MKYFMTAFVFVATPAFANPTYLDCSVKTASEEFTLKVTADEERQVVTVFDPSNGYTESGPAVFTASMVSLTRPSKPFGTITYEIDRATLALARTVVVGETRLIDRGICKLERAAKRAF